MENTDQMIVLSDIQTRCSVNICFLFSTFRAQPFNPDSSSNCNPVAVYFSLNPESGFFLYITGVPKGYISFFCFQYNPKRNTSLALILKASSCTRSGILSVARRKKAPTEKNPKSKTSKNENRLRNDLILNQENRQ